LCREEDILKSWEKVFVLDKFTWLPSLKKRASWQQYAAEGPSAIKTRLIEQIIIAEGKQNLYCE